jgi:hypothetical protein
MTELIYAGTLFDMELDSKKEVSMKKNRSIEDDIIPKNPNIAKNRRIKHNKPFSSNVSTISDVSNEPITAYDYSGTVDPFLNSLHLVKYYRSLLSYLVGLNNIAFAPYCEDTPYAAKVLDILAEHSRSNKIFLNSWIRFFYEYKLKGEKAKKTKYTSLMAFLETFNEYNSRHISA